MTNQQESHGQTRSLAISLELSLPFWCYGDLLAPQKPGFLLDSGRDPESRGRRSFLGLRPLALLTSQRTDDPNNGPGFQGRITRTTWTTPAGQKQATPLVSVETGDPLTALRDLLLAYRPAPAGGIPDPACTLHGGLVGYFGYESAYYLEDLPDEGRDDLELPDLAFLVVDEVLAHDHQTGQTTLHVTGRGCDQQAADSQAEAMVARWRRELADCEQNTGEISETTNPLPPSAITWRSHFDRPSYEQAVEKCRQHILAGDAFEICLTQRLETEQVAPPWELFCHLRRHNPAPFAAYLQLPGFQVVSASPERFLRLDGRGLAESRPIKGTRPRGMTAEEDQKLREDLATSPKDLAENVMIVDLVRNDLGKVCQIGSVEVPELQIIESYATVHQLVSTVQGRLREDCDALDLVRACFPGGSMTGAPKIEAMKIIDNLEPVKRGVYSGALGYLDWRGTMDLSIVIRTIVCKDGRCTLGVGGAVVADSDPAAEYQETLDKARALLEALGRAADRKEEA